MAQPQEKNQLLLLKVVGLLDDFTTLCKKIALLVDVKALLLNLIDKIEGIMSYLKSIIRNEKYAELMKSLCNLAAECKILVVDAECHINNIKKQGQDDSETIKPLKQAFINSRNVSWELNKIKSSVMESLKESETLCQRYHEVIKNLNEYYGQAKVECLRNESIAGVAGKGMIAGAFGGLSIYGGWNYGIMAILEEDIKRRSKNWSWEYIVQHRMNCHKYMNLYKQKLSHKKICENTQKEIDHYEKILDVLNITIWRRQAKIETKKEGKNYELNKQRKKSEGGWFSGLFRKKSDSKSVTLVDICLEKPAAYLHHINGHYMKDCSEQFQKSQSYFHHLALEE
ncbi:uncharacterized protein LOC124438866 [Xenia sp. Carnegie-2017]|uniref:uncharacterized protein LOC124438866 n=1 Tax=Xenia sp. Carnegie-2017 TaxID=2897299 RepID=UPI001F03EDA0|nr:uncharacterized protein LOC124438866 [Xenia sp. Carnegie-2017]